MRRRRFIAFAALLPLGRRAAAQTRIRRIGVLMAASESPVFSAYVEAFQKRLRELGWIEGRGVHVEVRWWSGEPDDLKRSAEALMAQKPDLVVPYGNLALATVKPLLGTVPAVFVGVGDPVGSGFVSNLARPGGTVTGFLSLDTDVGGKWVEILHEAVPGVSRVLALYEPENPSNVAMWLAVGQAALHYGIDAVAGPVHDSGEIERAVASFAAMPGGGIVVIPTAATNVNLALLTTLEERYRVPAIAARPAGMLAYGPDYADAMRRAAEYVDRILKGDIPGDLPVQAPAKYVLSVNLKIAKAIGITIPDSLLIRADEVIE